MHPILYPVFIHSILDLLLKNESGIAQEFFDAYSNEHRTLHGDDLQYLSTKITQFLAIKDRLEGGKKKKPEKMDIDEGGGGGGLPLSIPGSLMSLEEEKSKGKGKESSNLNLARSIADSTRNLMKDDLYKRMRTANKYLIFLSKISHNLF